ncbi:MAG: C40 family peptidase [Haliscomenobacter sp.]|nr:C40 family peptidase [Haliscomenobacter sp.]MBK8879518.1 C40 family peptidase [Haliscomenobacter sp.]
MSIRSCSKQLIWLFIASMGLSGCSVFSPGQISAKIAKDRQAREEIVEYSKKYLGLPYVYASRDPERGFDCSGFTHFVMKNFGIALSTSSSAQSVAGAKIAMSEAQPGDLVFFRHSSKGRVFHVALVVSNDPGGVRVIHATYRGIMIDNINQSSYWRRKIQTARRILA